MIRSPIMTLELVLLLGFIGVNCQDYSGTTNLTKIYKELTNKGNDSGPSDDTLDRMAEGMALFQLKKAEFQRQSGSASVPELNIEEYRSYLGPKANLTSHGEASPAVSSLALEGDMLMGPEQWDHMINLMSGSKKKRASVTNPRLLWDITKAVYFYVDYSLPATSAAMVRRAAQFWTQNTCLTIQENSNAYNVLRFYRGSGCFSYVGRQNWARQDVSIGVGCDSMGTVCHEMAHALGFYHTQSRYDRDSYLWINMYNVPGTLRYNFDKLSTATETHFGQSYDYGSVMQYDPYAFAINSQAPTSLALDRNYQNLMGQRNGPVFSDIREMNTLYKCAQKRCPGVNLPCQNFGFVNSRTCNTCICPPQFGGTYCDKLAPGSGRACNGVIIQATSGSYMSFTAVVGDNTQKVLSQAATCYWHIIGPAGRRLQFQILNMDTQCVEGCPWGGYEVNCGNFLNTGMMMCCASATKQIFTSTGNVITIRGVTGFSNRRLMFQYKVI